MCFRESVAGVDREDGSIFQVFAPLENSSSPRPSAGVVKSTGGWWPGAVDEGPMVFFPVVPIFKAVAFEG